MRRLVRRNYSIAALGLGLALFVALAIGFSRSSEAQLPVADYMMTQVKDVTLDYAIPSTLTPAVTADEAILSARKFEVSGAGATVQSARLAIYNDLQHKNVFIWAVSLEGLNELGGAGPVAGTHPTRSVFTRAVVFVSALEPNLVLGAYQAGPPQ